MYKRQYSQYDWVKYAIGACCLFGTGNFLLSQVAAKYGYQGMFPQALGQIFIWCFYHLSIKHEPFYEVNTSRIVGVSLRALNHLVCIFFNIMAFTYADKAHINQGVIAGLYTSGVVFTAFLFYFVYGEVSSYVKMLGMTLILFGVLAVSYKGDTTTDMAVEIDYDNLWIAVVFALALGMGFATNAWVVKNYIQKAGFTPIQLTVDALMVSGLVMLVGFIHTQMTAPMEVIDIANGIITSFLFIGGSICLAHSLQSGQGGPIQSIDSLKSLIPLFLHTLLTGIMPSALQAGGVALGIVGACIVGLSK